MIESNDGQSVDDRHQVARKWLEFQWSWNT